MGAGAFGYLFVGVLFFGAFGLVMWWVVRIDKKMDKKNRLGKESVYKVKDKTGRRE
jgi:hypothetical protein